MAPIRILYEDPYLVLCVKPVGVLSEDSPSGARAALAAGIPCLGFAAHGPDTPPALGLAALGVPLFHRMYDLPALLEL